MFSSFDENLSTIYNNLALAYQQSGEPENALSYYEKALEIMEKIFLHIILR